MGLVGPNKPGVGLRQLAEFLWRCTLLYSLDDAVSYRLDCLYGFFSHERYTTFESQAEARYTYLEIDPAWHRPAAPPAWSSNPCDMPVGIAAALPDSTSADLPGDLLRRAVNRKRLRDRKVFRYPSSTSELKERRSADR